MKTTNRLFESSNPGSQKGKVCTRGNNKNLTKHTASIAAYSEPYRTLWESLGLQGDQTSRSWRKSTLNTHWKDWCWSSNTLATWCEQLIHRKKLCCWERLKAEGEESDKDEMAEWHQWFNEHELRQTLGDGEGQRGLVCCSSWGCKETDTTEQLKNNSPIDEQGKKRDLNSDEVNDLTGHKEEGTCWTTTLCTSSVPGQKKIG